jgi:hypothetical protein
MSGPRDTNFNPLLETSRGANFTVTGKFSAAIKAIRKGYNALPASMRNKIEAYFKIEAFLKIVDTYTGTIDTAVKSTVERFMGRAEFPNTAWWVYKTFMAFVF